MKSIRQDWVMASMRPQPEGRGERETISPGAYRRMALQCGHSPKAVENTRRNPHTSGVWMASMRPQPEGRGEPQMS